MHPDLLDILSKSELPISNEQLAAYLTGKLNEEERHELEKSLTDSDDLNNDALEGLQLVKDKQKLQQYQLEISKSLREKLVDKKQKRQRKNKADIPWLTIAAVGFVAFLIMMWFLVRWLKSKGIT